jgi:hypothetical protein
MGLKARDPQPHTHARARARAGIGITGPEFIKKEGNKILAKKKAFCFIAAMPAHYRRRLSCDGGLGLGLFLVASQ